MFPSGIETRINCRAWTDKEKIENEIVRTVHECKKDGKQVADVGWTGVGLWVVHNWM